MTAREAVPVPVLGGERGNWSPEPAGTTGNHCPRFELVGDFIARAELEPGRTWLIDELVPDRGRLFVVSPPNAGKTWAALLAAHVATQQGRPVFFVEEEGSARGLAERMKALRIEPSPLFKVAHLQAVMLDDPSHRAMLIQELRDAAAPVMVLDPLVSLWRGDENSTKDANLMRGHLEELAKANPQALLIVLHHTSRASGNGGGSEVYAGRGSTVFVGWADMQLNLKAVPTPKGSGRVEVDVSVAKNREGERGHRARVQFDLATGEVTMTDSVDVADKEVRGKVLEALGSSIDGLSKNGIHAAAKGRKDRVLKMVDELVGEGAVVLEGKLYRLASAGGDE